MSGCVDVIDGCRQLVCDVVIWGFFLVLFGCYFDVVVVNEVCFNYFYMSSNVVILYLWVVGLNIDMMNGCVWIDFDDGL